MKTLPLIIIILFLCSCTENELVKNSLTKENIKGRVNTLTESRYSTVEKFGEWQKGDLNGKSLHEYDDKGTEIKRTVYTSIKDINFTTVLIFKYNEKGNQTEMDRYNSDGSLSSKGTYEFDDKGNVIEHYDYNADGSLDFKSTSEYKYDNKGNILEEDYYGSDGKLSSKSTYKYDDKGYKTEENRYNPDGSLDTKLTYKYDDRGNVIEETQKESGESFEHTLTYKYDEYDKKGNWLKKKEFMYLKAEGYTSDEEWTGITEREIEYY